MFLTRKKHSYRGHSATTMERVMMTLYQMEADIGLTKEELEAIEIAAQAVNDVRIMILDGTRMPVE